MINENMVGKLDLSLLSPSELIDENTENYIDIWKQESGDDKYLMSYFLETPAYNELIRSEKYIVSGRKGTGKTALRRAFISSHNNNDSILLDISADDIFTPSFFNRISDAVNENHNELKKDYKDKIKLICLIKWIELILECDTYIDISLKTGPLPSGIRQTLEDFLSNNGYSLNGDVGSRSFILDKVIISEDIGAELGVPGFQTKGTQKSQSTYSSQEFDIEQIRPQLEEFIFKLLSKTGKQCFLLIDGLDKIRTSSSSDIYKKIIIDFLVSVAQINEKMKKYISNNSRIIVFIRNDILNLISGEYDDMGKLTGDYTIHINWQSDYENEESLLNLLINKRIEGGIKIRTKGNVKKHYDKPLYLNVIQNSRISSNLYRNPPEALQDEYGKFDLQRFLYNKTLLRPRDFIQFFGLLSKSKTIYEFEKQYSNYLKSQLLDELKGNVKNYELVEKTINLVCKGQGSFKGQTFIDTYKSFSGKEGEGKDALQKMYEYGLIGYREKNQYQKVFTRFCYREEDTREFNPENCILHSGLYKAYGVI